MDADTISLIHIALVTLVPFSILFLFITNTPNRSDAPRDSKKRAFIISGISISWGLFLLLFGSPFQPNAVPGSSPLIGAVPFFLIFIPLIAFRQGRGDLPPTSTKKTYFALGIAIFLGLCLLLIAFQSV